MPAPAPLNVVVARQNYDTFLETHFLREVLLGALRRPVRVFAVEPGASIPATDDFLVLVFEDSMKQFIGAALERGVRNIGIFHIADELGTADRSLYPRVDYVIRNYHIDAAFAVPPGARCLDVIWAPNGYRSAVGPRRPDTLTPLSARSWPLWFSGFMDSSGDAKAERTEMVEVIQRHKLPATVMMSPAFAHGLGAPSYAAWMENTRFALVPRGRSPETIRLYDALELGAVPVTLHHPYLDKVMKDAPFPILGNWGELPAWYAAKAGASDRLRYWDAQQARIVAWWGGFKQASAARVADLVERAFARKTG